MSEAKFTGSMEVVAVGNLTPDKIGGDADIQVLPSRALQSFPDNNDIIPPVRENCFWQPGDLCIHFIGGCNYQKALDVMAFQEWRGIIKRRKDPRKE